MHFIDRESDDMSRIELPTDLACDSTLNTVAMTWSSASSAMWLIAIGREMFA